MSRFNLASPKQNCGAQRFKRFCQNWLKVFQARSKRVFHGGRLVKGFGVSGLLSSMMMPPSFSAKFGAFALKAAGRKHFEVFGLIRSPKPETGLCLGSPKFGSGRGRNMERFMGGSLRSIWSADFRLWALGFVDFWNSGRRCWTHAVTWQYPTHP